MNLEARIERAVARMAQRLGCAFVRNERWAELIKPQRTNQECENPEKTASENGGNPPKPHNVKV